jgi:predicted phosphodiesterase
MPTAKLPAAKHQRAKALTLPRPHPESYEHFRIDAPGRWLILSDPHFPYHDPETIKLAARKAKRDGVVGVLINGDALDYHELSEHDKDPRAARYVDEIETGREFARWLRQEFPRARIVFREGNHEERLTRYVLKNAPALFGLDCLTTPELLGLGDIGADWVGDRRVILLGKLPVLHGHEFGKGGGGAYPAAWLYRKAKHVALCGHFHRIDEHGVRNIIGAERRAWTVGCACYRHPRYLRLNDWANGCAFVEVAKDGTFSVDNLRVFGGKLV